MFDHRIFTQQVYGGISFYFARLAAALPAHGVQPTIVAPVHVNPAIAALPPGIVRGVRIGGGRGRIAVAGRVGRVLGPPMVRTQRADVHHETYYREQRLTAKGMPLVVTVHDMIHELFPDEFAGDPTPAAKRASIERADKVICISENTRRDLLRFHSGAENKISVVLHGVDLPGANGPRAELSLSGRPYLLYVGLRQGYKNFASLLAAFASSRSLRKSFDLVCIGNPFSADERAAIVQAGVAAQVRAVHATQVELTEYYRGAAAFVYPSLYEGFGMPPLEAMAVGCPVICLRTSCLPEICGTAAGYAEPGDVGELRDAIEAVVSSQERQANLRAAGLARARQFTWNACGAATAAVYRELV